MTDAERLAKFLALSAKLTGFGLFSLQGSGQAEPYLSTVRDIIGSGRLDELLEAYGRLQAAAPDEGPALDGPLRREILADEKLGPIARNIIKLWYVGIWYELPSAWREAFGAREKDFMHMVSAAAYTEGLLWPTIGANPSGAKAPGYGSWAEPPRIPVDGNTP
jgi:hypothetical protein